LLFAGCLLIVLSSIKESLNRMLAHFSGILSRLVTPEQLGAMYRTSPSWLADAVSLSAFRQTVRHVGRYSRFYREAFERAGIDADAVSTPADLGDFYTMPEDLASRPEDFICQPPQIVFESSGTSGKNKRVYYSDRELRDGGKAMAAGFRMMGISPQDRVANAFDFSIWIPGLITHYGLMEAGNFCLAFGKVDPIEVYRRLDLHRFTVVLGEPTWLIRLTELNERDGCRHKLKLLVGGAEEMPAAASAWMSRVWGGEGGGADVRMCYGSVEQGSGIGFQPCKLSGGYHVNTHDFLPEVIEKDDEGWGELVFTTLRRTVMPLVRYRTRDVTQLRTEPCPCGLHAPRILKLRGRRDELVVASGGNLYPLMFENILREVEGLTHDWQVVFTLEGVREVLTIRVESERHDGEKIEHEIHESAARQYPDLMKNLGIGIFTMRVEVHPPGVVRQARKLKRLIDRRHVPETNEARVETLEERRVLAGGVV
jgi:phenylacetate-CoA ligase